MLKVRQVSKKFWRKRALCSVDIQFEKGIYGLLGENGAGKTTLLRCIVGLYKPTEGEVYWNEKNVLQSKEYCDILGYLPQYFEGLKDLNIREVLEYFGDIKNIPAKRLQDRIESSLSAVNLLEQKEDKVRTLSGGMQRRLGIAQAILNEPKVLIFDEPTAGLDPKERLRFQNLISEYKESDSVVLISTHIVSDIESLCNHIIVMKSGQVLGVYTPEELAEKAKGKVYQLTEHQYELQKDLCFMISKTQQENSQMVRVLSDNELDGEKVNSNVEDGYLWITLEK